MWLEHSEQGQRNGRQNQKMLGMGGGRSKVRWRSCNILKTLIMNIAFKTEWNEKSLEDFESVLGSQVLCRGSLLYVVIVVIPVRHDGGLV